MKNIVFVLIVLLVIKSPFVINESNSKLLEFLSNVHKFQPFESVLVLRQWNDFISDEDFIRELYVSLEVPLILMSENDTCFIKKYFNSNILTVVFLESWHDELLNRLVENLQHMRSIKLIFVLNNENMLMDLFRFSWENGMINSIAVLRDFQNTSTIYSYNNFPAFFVEQTIWKPEKENFQFFPNRLRDLRGYTLPVFIGGPEHAMIVTRNKLGKIILNGYVGHLFESLLSKHNVKLNASLIDLTLPAQKIRELVLNKTVEITAAATYPEIPMDSFTYPYDFIDWCIMLPVEARMPVSKVFMIIVHQHSLIIIIGITVVLSALLESATTLTEKARSSLLKYFFNDSIFRGILGQTFTEAKKEASITLKLIYLLIFLLGLNIFTLYGAFLQTYITKAPSEKKIQSFDDLLASKLKVYTLKHEVDRLLLSDPRFRFKYYDMFYFETNFTKYANFKYTFDTKNAYVVTNIKWVIIQHRQKIYSHPIFRLPKGMCLFQNIPMAFPINDNSIYKDIINFLLLEIHSSGLMDFWKRRTFYELVEAGKLNLSDLTVKRSSEPLKVKDLTSIWIGMVLAYVLGGLCFLCEVWTERRENRARWKLFLD